jgi:quercetin dioxygenase-like cupin family protein
MNRDMNQEARTAVDIPSAAFVELVGLRGLRIARLGKQDDGRTLEVVEGARGVVIPLLTHPSAEHGRVLSGRIRFMQDGLVTDLGPGDRWEVKANKSQGPHLILENNTQVAILRDGQSALG